MPENIYMVHAEFTTWNTGSRFTCRSADVCLNSEYSVEEMWADIETIKQLCINFILTERPTFKIFMIDIKSIKDAPSKNKKEDRQEKVRR